MKTEIVLVTHGGLPNDFPEAEREEVFRLQSELRRSGPSAQPSGLEERYRELYHRLCAWPRSARNDPFYTASCELGSLLHRETGWEVLVAFNEFCYPTTQEAIDRAVAQGAESVLVMTTMLTPGGKHAAQEIPAAIARAQARNPETSISYLWPYEIFEVARFLAAQAERFIAIEGRIP